MWWRCRGCEIEPNLSTYAERQYYDDAPEVLAMKEDNDQVEADVLEPVDDSEFLPLSEVLRVLSNRTRLAIISLAMKHGEVCACRLQKALGLPQPTITVHLQKLYSSGLFNKRESWRYTYYSIRRNFESLLKVILENESTRFKDQEALTSESWGTPDMSEKTRKSERVWNIEHSNAQAIVTRVSSIPMTQPIPALIYNHLGRSLKEAFDCKTSGGVASGH